MSSGALRVLNLNVWFDLKLREKRTMAILEAVRIWQPSVCCFQEVVPEVARQLMDGLPGWHCSDLAGDGSSVQPYGVMIFVRPEMSVRFSFHDLPTNMARRLLVAEVSDLVVATIHLESLDNHKYRQEQLKVCAEVLRSYPEAILTGDFNFDSERNFLPPHDPLENVSLRLIPEFLDTWAELRPSDRGLTFDSRTNPYITKPEHMRYDRVMAKLHRLKAVSIAIVGDKPMDHLVELSAAEREWLERPPTPPRPSLRPRKAPDVFDSDDDVSTNGVNTGWGRAESPPPKKKGLFLSDHFGLLVDIEGNT